ncbi:MULTISPECIES: hypothetical protein [Nocardia]|uniref:hypothetical protein n=1 Tax=Nocardia TaxID=1817 RepID=UPI000B03C9CE|nr:MULTISPECIES: hypothetical protein [Nocardia]MBF6146090.1 hypothetical protein [Nocardia nova]
MAATDESRSGAGVVDRESAAPTAGPGRRVRGVLTRRRTVDLMRVPHGICRA